MMYSNNNKRLTAPTSRNCEGNLSPRVARGKESTQGCTPEAVRADLGENESGLPKIHSVINL